MKSELERLLRFNVLSERNSGEDAKHILMREAANRIAELEKALREVLECYEAYDSDGMAVAARKALGL